MKQIVAKGGVVVNIVGVQPLEEGEVLWIVEDDYVVSVGDAFDHRDSRYDEMNIGLARLAERHETAVRSITRAIRRLGAQGNAAADAEGLPQSAAIPDLTTAQFREFAKTFIP